MSEKNVLNSFEGCLSVILCVLIYKVLVNERLSDADSLFHIPHCLV